MAQDSIYIEAAKDILAVLVCEDHQEGRLCFPGSLGGTVSYQEILAATVARLKRMTAELAS